MAFEERQTRALKAKLNGQRVRQRTEDGKVLHYIEGWYAVTEANRIFGFDTWDRETLELRMLGQEKVDGQQVVSYLARSRITVRAGDLCIRREGAGTGHGRSQNPGQAHEMALKAAETDAMKRALSSFGNPFGLALYDSERKGVRETPPTAKKSAESQHFALVTADGTQPGSWAAPEQFCHALRRALGEAKSREDLEAVWRANEDIIERLRTTHPDLKAERAMHHVDVLARLYRDRLAELTPEREEEQRPQQSTQRLRDREHLGRVAQEPCLVCGRQPAEAHHLRFMQPRAMGKKVGDQFTVPLCRLHHQELHHRGDEEAWWRARKLDPTSEAERHWALSRPVTQAS